MAARKTVPFAGIRDFTERIKTTLTKGIVIPSNPLEKLLRIGFKKSSKSPQTMPKIIIQ